MGPFEEPEIMILLSHETFFNPVASQLTCKDSILRLPQTPSISV